MNIIESQSVYLYSRIYRNKYMFYLFKKNYISICFVHKSQKWAIFGLTCKDKRSHDYVTVGPIFKIIVSKDAQDPKNERYQISAQDSFVLKIYCKKNRG